jgi:hypothetical protein
MSGSKRVKGSKRPRKCRRLLAGISLRAPSLRPLRRRESANQCALRPDPRHLRSLHHNRRVLRAGNGSQSRSHPWPTRAVTSPKVPRAGYWPTWAPPMGRYAYTIAPTRATAKATCASLSSPAARTCCASTANRTRIASYQVTRSLGTGCTRLGRCVCRGTRSDTQFMALD